jgi:HlyD family secretion protein
MVAVARFGYGRPAVSDQLSNDLASLRIDREAAGEGRGRLRAALLYTAVGLGLAAGLVFGVLPAMRGKFSRPRVELTEVALVSPSQASIELTATGYVVPQTVSQVAAKVGGRVTEVRVKQGETVKAGDVLMLLDPIDLDAQIAAARARVATARANVATAQANLGETEQQLAREKRAAESGISGSAVAEDLARRADSLRATVKAADASARAAQAEVQALEVTRGGYTVTSPIDGRVVNKPPQPGEMVGPAMAGIASQLGGIEIADFSTLAVETDVPEGRLGLISLGGSAEIVLDAFADRRFRGEVSEIVPKVDRAKATVPVKVRFVDPVDAVLPEMSARVGFLAGELDAEAIKQPPRLIVPGSAVTERAGAKVVFALEGDRLRMIPIELGAPFGDGFELSRGPAPGTKVVKHPAAELADGTQVKEKSRD